MTIFHISRVSKRAVEDPGLVRFWQEDVELRHTSETPMPWKDMPEIVTHWLEQGHEILPDGRVTQVYHERWTFVEVTTLADLLRLMQFYACKIVLDRDDDDFYDAPPSASYSGYELLLHDDYLY